MARTAIVNPRNRKKRKTSHPAKRRARSYGRKRNPSRTANRRPPAVRRRRRNPGTGASVYSSGGYRQSNPSGDLFDLDYLMETIPAATGGVWAARWAAKMAGPFEVVDGGKDAVPTFKHAIAMVLGARFGSQAIGSFMGAGKEVIAEHAALGFAGDLFARKRVFADSSWVQQNLMLEGVDYEGDYGDDTAPEYAEDLSGFEQDTALGAGGEYVVGPDGTLYQMQGVADDQPGAISGFEQTTALGFSHVSPSSESGFGYA